MRYDANSNKEEQNVERIKKKISLFCFLISLFCFLFLYFVFLFLHFVFLFLYFVFLFLYFVFLISLFVRLVFYRMHTGGGGYKREPTLKNFWKLFNKNKINPENRWPALEFFKIWETPIQIFLGENIPYPPHGFSTRLS